MVDPNDLIAALRQAKERLRGHWWHSGIPQYPGCCCAATALMVTNFPSTGVYELAKIISDGQDDTMPVVFRWNDAPGRTEDEVLDLYDRTIARLQSSQGAST